MGKRLGKPFWIWVDNQLVFNILKSCLVHQPPEVTAHEKDHDLNQLLVDLALSSLSRGGWQDVVKVTSHQEAWAFSGNEAADRCAVEGRSHFPEGTLTIWEALMDHSSHSKRLRGDLHKHFIRAGTKAVACKNDLRKREAQRAEVDNLAVEDQTGRSDSEDVLTPAVTPTTLTVEPTDAVFAPYFGAFAGDIYRKFTVGCG